MTQIKKPKGDFLDDVYTLLHPMRFRIVELLSEKPMHIAEISKALGMERRLASYHLKVLEDSGFLTSKYEISEEKKSKGKALRKYTVTDKVANVKDELKKEL